MITHFEQLVDKARRGQLDAAQLADDLPKVQAEVRANAQRAGTTGTPVQGQGNAS